jgi:hypothetical protein
MFTHINMLIYIHTQENRDADIFLYSHIYIPKNDKVV